MRKLVRPVVEAFFLGEQPYAEMRGEPRSALRGLTIIVLMGVVVALVGLIGTTVEWATMPEAWDIEPVVWEGIQDIEGKLDPFLPNWYRELRSDPEFRPQIDYYATLLTGVVSGLFGAAPDLSWAALSIITLPLGLAVVWALYGLVAHLVARLLGGELDLGQTLGCTALAVALQILNIATFFPFLIVGGVVGTWTLLCRYVALKACHRMTWERTLAATLLPYVAFNLVMVTFGCLAAGVYGMFVAGGAQ